MIKYIGNNLLEYDGIENSSMEECIKYCKSKKILGLDIETGRLYPKNRYREDVYKPGLDPHMTRIVMIQIGDLDSRFVIDARVVDYSGLKEILEDSEILKVGANLKFEGKFFLKYLGCRLVNVWDCMIVEKLLYNGLRKSNSLSAMMYRYLGIQPIQNINLFSELDKKISSKAKHLYNTYLLSGIEKDIEDIEAEIEQEMLENEFIDKSIRMGFIDIGDAPFTLKQVKYGDEDITAPLKIYKKQLEGVNDWNPKIAIELENRFTQVLAEIELKGMHFDQQKWLDIYNDALILYNKRLDKLNQFIEDNYPQYCGSGDLFSQKPVCAIKWTSSKQVISFLSPLGWCPKETSKSTGKHSYTVGAKAMFRLLNNENKGRFFKQKDLDKIEDEQSFILQYLLFKKSEQAITTFGKDWLKYVHPVTKRVHSTYRQLMNTTRPSSTNPNLLNIPAGSYRYAFSSSNGWKIVNCDYAGQELRTAAHIHNVSKMIQFFNEGDPKFGSDFHSYSATQMQRAMKNDPNYVVEPKELSDGSNNPNFTSEHSKERNDSKAITFLMNYG